MTIQMKIKKAKGEYKCIDMVCDKCPYWNSMKQCMCFKRDTVLNEALNIIIKEFDLSEEQIKYYEEKLKEKY